MQPANFIGSSEILGHVLIRLYVLIKVWDSSMKNTWCQLVRNYIKNFS